jgi:hypothetical protein
VLHWSKDEWHHVHDTRSTHTAVGLDFVDIDVTAADRAPVRFTFNWLAREKWEGRDYAVELRESGDYRERQAPMRRIEKPALSESSSASTSAVKAASKYKRK